MSLILSRIHEFFLCEPSKSCNMINCALNYLNLMRSRSNWLTLVLSRNGVSEFFRIDIIMPRETLKNVDYESHNLESIREGKREIWRFENDFLLKICIMIGRSTNYFFIEISDLENQFDSKLQYVDPFRREKINLVFPFFIFEFFLEHISEFVDLSDLL